MRASILIVILLFMGSLGYSQSKKDFNNQVISLTAEKQKLIGEILDLKQQIVDLKTELLDCKSDNSKLQMGVASNNSTTVGGPGLGLTDENKSSSDQTNNKCQAMTAKGTQCTRNADAGSKYCWQHKKTYEPTSTSTSSTKNFSGSSTNNSSSSGSRTIYTGSRGGKYYINSHGNKTYVKHK